MHHVFQICISLNYVQLCIRRVYVLNFEVIQSLNKSEAKIRKKQQKKQRGK